MLWSGINGIKGNNKNFALIDLLYKNVLFNIFVKHDKLLG